MPSAGSLGETGYLPPLAMIAAIIAIVGVIAQGIATWHRMQAAGTSEVKDVLVSVRHLVCAACRSTDPPVPLRRIRETEEKLVDLTTFRLVFMCPTYQTCIWDPAKRTEENREQARQAALLRSQRAGECLTAVEAARERWRSLLWRWVR